MNQPATRDDVNRLGTAVEALADAARVAGEQQAAAIRDFLEAYRPPGPVQQMHFQPPPPARTERLAWVMVVMVAVMGAFTGAAVTSVVLIGQRVTDLRADMHAERASREAFDNWNAQEVTAIRSYITNGKLQPMAARPQPEDSR